MDWAHSGSEAQQYAYDELGRLADFKEGAWNGTSIATPYTASHTINLDELGNWRNHQQCQLLSG